MKNKQQITQYKKPFYMKGVTDTFYLAFVGFISIGGALYIYNDINTNNVSITKTNTPSSTVVLPAAAPHGSSIEQVAIKPATKDNQIAETVETADEPKILAVEIEKVKTVIVETKDSQTNEPVVEAVSQKSVTEIIPVAENIVEIKTIETPVVKATIETNQVDTAAAAPASSEPMVNEAALANQEPAANAEPLVNKEQLVKQESVAIEQPAVDNNQSSTENEADANQSKPMTNPHQGYIHPAYVPMPIPEFVQPHYNDGMQQAHQYMPPAYRPQQYNNTNQNYNRGYRNNYPPQNRQNANSNYNNQAPQGWQEQQREQYNNRQQPENYAPWNPGRFY